MTSSGPTDSDSNGDSNNNGNGGGDAPIVVMVPLDMIVPDPDQPRTSFTERSLTLLAENIERHGLLSPVHLRPPREDGKCVIVSGDRRVRAVRKLGWSEIAATIRWEDERDLILIQGAENLAREQLGPVEILALVERLLGTGFTRAEIVEGLGVHRMTVNRYARVSAHAEARTAFLGGASLRCAVAMTTARRGGELATLTDSTATDGHVADVALPSSDSDTGADDNQDQVIPASAPSADEGFLGQAMPPSVSAGDEARHDRAEGTATRAASLHGGSRDVASDASDELAWVASSVDADPALIGEHELDGHELGEHELDDHGFDDDVYSLSEDEIREIEQIQKEQGIEDHEIQEQEINALDHSVAETDKAVQLACAMLAGLPDPAFLTSLTAAYERLDHVRFERDELDEL